MRYVKQHGRRLRSFYTNANAVERRKQYSTGRENISCVEPSVTLGSGFTSTGIGEQNATACST